jgi:hypothetical protein
VSALALTARFMVADCAAIIAAMLLGVPAWLTLCALMPKDAKVCVGDSWRLLLGLADMDRILNAPCKVKMVHEFISPV